MRNLQFLLVLCLAIAFSLCPAQSVDAGWTAGLAKSVITPKQPIWMAGYGGRTAPADGTEQDLFVRVLALEDDHGHRGIVLAGDILGVPQSLYDDLARRLKNQFDLDRSHRSGVGLAGVNLELAMGYLPRGSAVRDLLEISRLIDSWSVLNLPL